MNKLKSVLLVDDDDAANFINKQLFKKLDVANELVTAGNGKDAI